MENRTRFDLNAAIENWKQELTAQASLTAEVRHELETHLRDAIAGFQQNKFCDEEAFWLARRRIGHPQQIAEEFMKANPLAVWRERVFWMTISLVGSYVFMTWKDFLWSWFNQSDWVQCLFLIPVMMIIGTIVAVRRGRVPDPSSFEAMASWKIAGGLFAILAITVLTAYWRGHNLPSGGEGIGAFMIIGANIALVTSWFSNAVWPLVMVLILASTLKRKARTPKRA